MATASKNEALNTLTMARDYWVVNWRVVEYFGRVDEAILLGYFCSMQRLYGNEDGEFYRTVPCVKADTTFDVRRQRRAIDSLVHLGVLQTANIGIPRRRSFYVNNVVLLDFLVFLKEDYALDKSKRYVYPHRAAKKANSEC